MLKNIESRVYPRYFHQSILMLVDSGLDRRPLLAVMKSTPCEQAFLQAGVVMIPCILSRFVALTGSLATLTILTI